MPDPTPSTDFAHVYAVQALAIEELKTEREELRARVAELEAALAIAVEFRDLQSLDLKHQAMDELRRAVCLIKITAYNGEELIRRGSVLDVIDLRRLNP